MTDIIELILADHARIRRLLADVEIPPEGVGDTESRAELPDRWETLAALLELHAAAAEEIGFPALFGRAATLARDKARATHDDLREAVGETRLYPAGSRLWRLAVFAARAAAMDHIHDLESGALARFRRGASVQTREALGYQWTAFVAACTADDTSPGPFG
jgi:Hemerythrin HHE cation binding domain